MNENVANLILVQLREIRGEMIAMRKDIAVIRSDVSRVDRKVDGLTVTLPLLAGHVHHVGDCVEQLEKVRGD